MSIDHRVISIGTLDANPLWEERLAVRSGHATVTLVSAGNAKILVNPSLPPAAMCARLAERAPVQPGDITHVFLTSFLGDHRRGLPAFEDAIWLLHEPEAVAAGAELEASLNEAKAGGDLDVARHYQADLDLLRRCRVADDTITRGVDLFPVPGMTPGTCGLLLPLPRQTVLVCGDAVATVEHFEQGKVLPTAVDVALAQESFRECLEIADVLVPGRDNVIHNPMRALM